MNLIKKITKEAKKYFKGENGCHDFYHTDRVRNLALHIGKIENADLEVLEIASILHDIGRKEQNKCKGKICHAEVGAKKAEEILKEFNLETKKFENIIHCIETHRFRKGKTPESLEAKILYDADKLDSIGAVGIGRAFLFAGEFGAKLHNKDVDIEKTKPYTKEDTAYREFLVKLKKIKDKMLTDEGKRLAQERHEFMVIFFDRLNKEVDGEI
ncbi:HD domain-containing protein [Candidatus Gracilibacteria bacterium]|nr:HD domain-containing protein [Candidatus Gracilibacteria bacterium]